MLVGRSQIAALEENIRQLKGKENYLGRELAAARAQLEEANARKPQEEGQMVEENANGAFGEGCPQSANACEKALWGHRKAGASALPVRDAGPLFSQREHHCGESQSTAPSKPNHTLLGGGYEAHPSHIPHLPRHLLREPKTDMTFGAQDLTKLVSEFEADLAQFSSRYPESRACPKELHTVLFCLQFSVSVHQKAALGLPLSSLLVVVCHVPCGPDLRALAFLCRVAVQRRKMCSRAWCVPSPCARSVLPCWVPTP
eukprot:1797711-Rhodomonas_salina.1